MSCATLTVFDISMATTQLGSAEHSERLWPLSQRKHSQQRHPIMNWVVVTDDNGIRRLRLHWCLADSDS